MYQKEKEQCIQICHLLYSRQLVAASDGNISLKVEADRFIFTPSGVNKGFLTWEDLLVTDGTGQIIEGEGRVTKEFELHQKIYQNRPEVTAVVHTHPVYATAFAMTGQGIPEEYLIESKQALGSCVVAEYAPPGSQALADNLEKALGNHQVVLLKNHGAVTFGKNLIEAYNRMEILETVAKTIAVSRLIGIPSPIPKGG